MSRLGDLGHRLYRGEVSYDFIGKRRRWYTLSGLVILVGVISLLTRGLNPSIDFKGGASFEVTHARATSVAAARTAVASAGVVPQVVQKVGPGVQVETASVSTAQANRVQDALAHRFGVSVNDVAVTQVGPTWGGQITQKAAIGLVVFLVLFVLLASMFFEPKMALAAIIALCHDLLVTAGIYSLSGFLVSPATVIALLTILGYSLYDTVVVFDKVRENTAGLVSGSRMTYSQAVNSAVNQTLVRSINTSLIALFPVASILVVGAYLLGAGTLKELALALLVGLLAGAYSSIFLASPLLADLKEREPQYRSLARRVANRQSAEARGRGIAVAGAPTPAAAVAAGAPLPGAEGPAAVDPLARTTEGGVGSGTAPERRPVRPPVRPAPRKPTGRGGRPGGGKRHR